MSRAQLEDQILLVKRELETLQNMKTDCLSCDNLRRGTSYCVKFQQDVPAEFMARTDCPNWEFALIPF